MKNKLLGFFSLVLLMIGNVIAQEPTKPGKEHEFLKELVGEWEMTMDGDMKGTSKYRMVHGGLWLESHVEMDMPQGKFTGQGLDSYDAAKKKYVAIWVDSMSGSPLVMEGTMDAATKTLTMVGKGPSPDGSTVEYKTTTEYKSKDHHIFKMWMGNTSGDPMMTANYKRKK